jgi:hypothetical protein
VAQFAFGAAPDAAHKNIIVFALDRTLLAHGLPNSAVRFD